MKKARGKLPIPKAPGRSTDSVSARAATEPRTIIYRLTWSSGVDPKNRAEYFETMPGYSKRLTDLREAAKSLGVRFSYVLDELEYTVKQSHGGESFVEGAK